MKSIQITFIALLISTSVVKSQELIKFQSGDGVEITADFYEKGGSEKIIILFHQAGWSRGEYGETAPKLNDLGYSCLAVDLRSGGKVNKIINETYKSAVSKGKATSYKDAFQDIEAAVAYVKETFNPKKLILLGSSYSSALVLKYGGDYPDAIQGILSFSPGEYFGSNDFIKKSAEKITVPVFITSAKNEPDNWKGIYDVIPAKSKQNYIPATKGNHGSRALWKVFSDNAGYWDAVTSFLATI